MHTTAPSDLLTTAEAAAYLNVTPETIRRRIRAGHLPAYRLGPRLLGVSRADLEAYPRRYVAEAVAR